VKNFQTIVKIVQDCMADKRKLSSATGTNNASNQRDQSQKEYSHQLSEELEFATKSDPYAVELEERFRTVSNDLNDLDKNSL
jgi:hypothetical protein